MTLQEFRNRFKYDPKKDLVAHGGFADVYMAEDDEERGKYRFAAEFFGRRKVALKFYKMPDEKKYTLEREVKMAMGLQHPNICRYLERKELEVENVHGEVTINHVAVMEYLDGGHIDKFVKLFPKHLDKLLTDVLWGIDHLHQQKTIHRDIKPSNLLGCYLRLDPNRPSFYEIIPATFVDTGARKENESVGVETLQLRGNAHPPLSDAEYIVPAIKITDFGISKSLDAATGVSSRLFGSKPYMAPEQIEETVFGVDVKNEKGETIRGIDTRVDIWSFGVMAYELITGNRLFKGIEEQTDEQVRKRILSDDIAAKINEVEGKYRALLSKCLVRRAEDRCNSCTELIGILNGDIAAEKNRIFAVHIETAQKHIAAKDLESANTEIEKALGIKKDSIEAQTMRDRVQNLLSSAKEYYRDASVHYGKEEYDEAKTVLQKAIDIFATYNDAKTLLTRVEEKLKKPVEDTLEWKKTDGPEMFYKHVTTANGAFASKDYEKAKAATKAALALRPNDTDMMGLLAKIEKALLVETETGDTKPEPPPATTLKNAPRWKRLINTIIDTIIVFLFVRIIMSLGDLEYYSSWDWNVYFFKLYTICAVVYYTVFELLTGRTLGKTITGTRVVNKYGNRINIETAFLRSLVRVCFVWADQIMAISKMVFHDTVTLTRCVNFPKGSMINKDAQAFKIPVYMKAALYTGCALNLILIMSNTAVFAYMDLFSISEEHLGLSLAILHTFPGLIVAAIIGFIFKPKKGPITVDAGQIVYNGNANCFLDGVAIGGRLYLSQDKLIFRSHALNMVDHNVEVPLKGIAHTKTYNVSGWAPTGLEILLKDGRNEKFVVNKRSVWISNIETAVRKNSEN